MYNTSVEGSKEFLFANREPLLMVTPDSLDKNRRNMGNGSLREDTMKRVSGVYKITNIVNGKFYVGSSKDIERRRKQHFSKRGGSLGLTRAILKHGIDNFIHEILEECPEEELIKREQHFIDLLKPQYNLSHIAGRIEHTPEVRDKLSAAMRKIWQSEEYRANAIAKKKGIPSWNKGIKSSPETIEKLRASHLGIPHSSEWRIKMRGIMTGRKMTDSDKAKMSAAQKGHAVTEEAKINMSLAHLGKPSPRKGCKLSDETKAKISLVQIGHVASEETRAKMRASSRHQKPSDEHMAKLSALFTGKPLSEEHCKKLSVAHMGNTSALGHRVSDEAREKISIAVRKHNQQRMKVD
jgi:group I intron endonuclease